VIGSPIISSAAASVKRASVEPQIVATNLGKTFTGSNGDVVAVEGVDLTVRRGEFCCIVGPSGCGKSTLLRILAGLEPYSSGALELYQYEPSKPLHSMVFQETSIFPWMTVAQNVADGLRRRGVKQRDYRDVVAYYLEKVGLAKFERAFPHQLSGGMKQRVAIARAFANDLEILLMDEPFGALDEQTKLILQEELMRIWMETRKTVVFITHSIDETIVLSDRAVVMTARPGRIKADVVVPFGRPRDLFELRAQPEYAVLSERIWNELRTEVAASSGIGAER
jgi:NitT/TauT family transport system ATP-binding protein